MVSGERVTFSFDSAGWLYVYQHLGFQGGDCQTVLGLRFGVAVFLQEHLLNGADPKSFPEGLGFSGSSAGALTASLLASGTSVPDVFEHVLAQCPKKSGARTGSGRYKVCRRRPWMMQKCAEEALKKCLEEVAGTSCRPRYQFPGAFKVIAGRWVRQKLEESPGRLRILVTRALLRPPFFMGALFRSWVKLTRPWLRRCSPCSGEVVDEFPDNEKAIELLMASCHIPGICGVLPKKIDGK